MADELEWKLRDELKGATVKGSPDRSETLLKELHAEMRSIRDADLKLLPFYFTIAGFTLAGNGAIAVSNSTSVSAKLAFWVGLISIAFVAHFWWRLEILVSHNNKKYQALGLKVRAIWKYWKVDGFTSMGQKTLYGEGDGYLKTLLLIRSCALFVMAAIFLVAAPRSIACVESNYCSLLTVNFLRPSR